MRLRTAALLLFVLCTISLNAQTNDSVSTDAERNFFMRYFLKLEDLLDLRDMNKNYDTLYISRAPKGLKLRLSLKTYGSDIYIKGVHQDYTYRAELEAKNKYTLSLCANYRGLALALALNPAKWTGWNKDFEVTLNAYGNKIGADLVYQTANTFKGDITISSDDVPLTTASMGVVSQDLLIVNAYYVFNGKKFSYPAAFGQTWLQRRSAGSWMIGATLFDRKLSIGEIEEFESEPFHFDSFCIGIGAGYAHNFVLRKGWMLHFSVLPEIVVRNRSHITVSDERSTMKTRFPEFINVARMSATRHFGKYFAGLNSVIHFSNVGDRDILQIENLKWQAFLFFGFQL